MDSFDVQISEVDGIPVVYVFGYFAEDAGSLFQEKVEQMLRRGKVKIVFDFSKCKAINSLGISFIVDLVMRITDDFKGKVVLSGLDKLKKSTLTMVGIIPLADEAPDSVTGVKKILA